MREEAAVVFEGVETTDDFAMEFVSRKSVRNHFFRLWNDFDNGEPQLLKRTSVGFRNFC